MFDYLLRNLFYSEMTIYEVAIIHVIKSDSKVHPCVYSRHNMAADTLTAYIGM